VGVPGKTAVTKEDIEVSASIGLGKPYGVLVIFCMRSSISAYPEIIVLCVVSLFPRF